MNTDLVKIYDFKKFLNDVQMRAKESATVTSANMDKMLKLDPTPFDRAMYENFFDSASKIDSNETTYISQLTKTKEKIDGVIDTINSNLVQRNEIKQIINNQQLRSGLTGLAKKNILDAKSRSEILQYPDYIQEIVTGPHVDTPFKKEGGKLTRRNRKRQIKSKKRRSLHK
jgi:hypothetical protein